jgi:PAS domain S-box-containing protein
MYHELVECQQDLIIRFSPEGRLQFVNPAYCAITGKTRDELEGSVFMPVTSERYSDVMATQMAKLFRPPFTCLVEQWIPSSKGLRCISWSATSILDGEKKVKAIIATGRDVTRYKQAERTVRHRDDDFMLLIESGQQMYYSHTPENTMLYVSPRIRALLGCRPRGGKKAWTDYLSDNPVNGAGLERTLRAVSSGRREPPYRLEFIGKDNVRVWVEVNEIPVVKNGKTIAITGSMIDITEKMKVDEGVTEAELLFKGTGKKDGQNSPEDTARRSGFRSVF